MPGQKILIDTGPLVAILDADDPAHAKCVEAFRSLPAPNYTCWPVLTEACYLLRSFPKAVAALLDEVADGDLIPLPLQSSDVSAIRQTFDTYHDPVLLRNVNPNAESSIAQDVDSVGPVSCNLEMRVSRAVAGDTAN